MLTPIAYSYIQITVNAQEALYPKIVKGSASNIRSSLFVMRNDLFDLFMELVSYEVNEKVESEIKVSCK